MLSSTSDLVSASVFRLKTPAHNTPSPAIATYKLKCFYCGKVQFNGITEKFCIEGRERAKDIMDSTRSFKDTVCTQVSDLDTVEKLLAADPFITMQTAYINRYRNFLILQNLMLIVLSLPLVLPSAITFRNLCHFLKK